MLAGVQPLIKIRQRWHTLTCRTATTSTSAWRLSCDQRAATRELLFQQATSDTCKHAFLGFHLPLKGHPELRLYDGVYPVFLWWLQHIRVTSGGEGCRRILL